MGRHAIDETNNVYGRLTVLERVNSTQKDAMWLCQCECGNQRTVSGTHLRSGFVQSCNCLKNETSAVMGKNNALPKGVAAFNNYVSKRKYSAKKRGHEWELSKEQVWEISQRDCYYCGSHPASVNPSRNGTFVYNGIDRINNDFGYLLDNVVPCCGDCNRSKFKRTEEEFILHCQQVAEHAMNRP